MSNDPLSAAELLAHTPGWGQARASLLMLRVQGGQAAQQRAEQYATRYAGRRAAMVFDVVASARRKYTLHVLPMVERFESSDAASSLTALAKKGVPSGLELRAHEPIAMQQVAAGLVAFAHERGLGEEDGVRAWADAAGAFAHAPKLEPYVGHVRGIGPALFAYLRMRCGANAIKPDSRVRDVLAALGFPLTSGEHDTLVLAEAVAAQAGIGLLELDQLLWWAAEEQPWLHWTHATPDPNDTDEDRAERGRKISEILFASGKMVTADGKTWGDLHPEFASPRQVESGPSE